jgi:hypothetical protein
LWFEGGGHALIAGQQTDAPLAPLARHAALGKVIQVDGLVCPMESADAQVDDGPAHLATIVGRHGHLGGK